MAANKRKILENARKLAQKGAKDKALKEYEKLVKLDPKDSKLRLEIGDAYRRWGQVEEAIDTYNKVADQYMKEGFDARAVAVYKQILNLDPERHASYPPLAELYERMGLTAEAIGALQTAADGYHREGKKKEALDLLRRMATIDPANTTSRIKVAELLRQEGMAAEAIAEYQEVATELTRQGDAEAAGKIHRRILEMDPSRPDALAAFARNLLAQKKGTEAETVAKRALAADEQNPEHYELLADVYRAQGRNELLADVYRPLADLYRQRGDEDRARDILQRFVPPDAIGVDTDAEAVFDSDPVRFDAGAAGEPNDELSLDDSSFGGGGSMGDGAAELELGPELELDGDGPLELSQPVGQSAGDALELDGADASLELSLGADATVSNMRREGPVAAQPEKPAPISGDPDQLMAEASVYLRYGKRERAIAHLEAILQQEPAHRSALEKLGEAYAEGGDERRAVAYWLDAAKHAQADADAAAVAVLRGRIEALDPDAAATLAGAEPEPEPELEEPSFGASDPGDDLADDVDFDLDIDLDDSEVAADDDAQAEAPDLSSPSLSSPSLSSPGTSRAGTSASLSTTTAQQIQEDLEEADFYMEQGLHNEAEEIYQRVLAVAPNHPKALLRLGEVAAARGEDPSSTGVGKSAKAKAPAAKAPAAKAPAAVKPAPAAKQRAPEPEPEPELDEAELSIDFDDEAELSDAPPAPVAARARDAARAIDVAAPGEDSLDLASDLPGESQDLDPVDEDPVDEDPVDEDTGVDVSVEEEASSEEEATEEETGEFSVSTESLVKRPAPHPAAGGDAGFDLAAELSDVFDDQNEASLSGEVADDGFAAVFEAFKRGVSQTLSAADHAAHYDLGIAYKEMGLYDDAIQEFRAAMVHPPRVVECLHLIALCGLDAGQNQLALEHLEQLLESEGANDEQRLAARFDLGRAHEAMGALAEARAAYQAVAAVDADFQGVSKRLAGLAKGKPAAPRDTSDDFESFEDVMSEVEDEEPQAERGESFDDLIAEVSADDAADESEDDGSEDDDTEDERPEVGSGALEAVLELEAETEPEPEPVPAPRAPRKPVPVPAKKKRKKISFL